MEHITDFDSASDLTLTLRKFQDLGLPLFTNPPRQVQSQASVGRSVFEDELDNTDPAAGLVSKDGKRNQRWKFDGPWVTGMSQGDFMAYVTKQLRTKKLEFIAYVKQRHLEMAQSDARNKASIEGSRNLAEERTPELSEQEFDNFIKKLRSQFDLNSDLARYMTEFLDLPTSSSGAKMSFIDTWGASEKGPPATHLSGGLSYLKSSAIMENHPIFGPQSHRKPVQARVLVAPGTDFYGHKGETKGAIGIAGFVAEDPLGASVIPRVRAAPEPAYDDIAGQRDKIGKTIGVDTEGGNRIWVWPTRASVNEKGRLSIHSENADKTSVGVHTGELKAPDMPMAPPRSSMMPFGLSEEDTSRANNRLDSPQLRLTPHSGRYGLEDDNIRSLEEHLNLKR